MGGAIAGTMGFRVRETVKAADPAHLVRGDGDRTSAATTTSSPTTPGRQLSDEWYSPYLLRVDEAPEHLQAGATWTINYIEDQDHQQQAGRRRPTRPRRWTVDGVDVVTAVPAGTFNALKVTRTDTADGSTKTQWFVRGVGKVRERDRPAATSKS